MTRHLREPRVSLRTAGTWINYVLRSENQGLRGFVVLGNNQGVQSGPLN